MHQPPTFQGCIPTASGQPTLVFSTGFLVQACRDQAQRGWHAFVNQYQIGANLDPEIAAGLQGMNAFKRAWEGIFRQVSGDMLREHSDRVRGIPHDAGSKRYVLFDTPDLEVVLQASIYTFGGALMRAGDVGHAANFDATYATRTLGELNGNGLPAHHPVVAAQNGIVSIS